MKLTNPRECRSRLICSSEATTDSRDTSLSDTILDIIEKLSVFKLLPQAKNRTQYYDFMTYQMVKIWSAIPPVTLHCWRRRNVEKQIR